jgi:hypothetical protein
MDIGRCAPRYQKMALLYPQSKQLQACLTEYFIVVVGFCHQIWKFVNKSVLNRFISTLSDLKEHQSNVESWAKAIKEEVNLLITQNLNNNGQEIVGIKTLVTKGLGFITHQRSLQNKLRVLDLCSTYDFQRTWKQTRKIGNSSLFSQCTDYQNWRSKVRSSTLIYIGKLGSGKSVLLANIIDDLCCWVQERTTPVAYFFCRFDAPESLKARTILGSLTRQLLQSIQNITLVERLPDENLSYLDLESIQGLLERGLPVSQLAYFILDGLDECDSMTVDLVLRQLQKL